MGNQLSNDVLIDMDLSNDVLIAMDCSGSTGGSFFYHGLCEKIISKIFENDINITILFWDTSATIKTRKSQKEWNEKKSGGGGTSPYCVADYIKKNNFHGDLVFITDGQVNDVDTTSKLLINWNFTNVYCHLIDTGGIINMSCTCAFTRSSPHTITLYNSMTPNGFTKITITLDELDLISSLTDIFFYLFG
jgi:hypothetical protein